MKFTSNSELIVMAEMLALAEMLASAEMLVLQVLNSNHSLILSHLATQLSLYSVNETNLKATVCRRQIFTASVRYLNEGAETGERHLYKLKEV